VNGPPEISVLVCTRNRSRALVRCLEAVSHQQTSFPFEIVVVDNGSTDDTRARVDEATRGDPRIRYIVEPEPGLSRARNRGAAIVASPLIVSLDDDAEPVAGWLEALHRAAAETDAAAIGGPILARFEVPPPAWLAGQLRVLSAQDYGAQRRAVESSPYLFGGNLAIRRVELDRVGGFDEALGRQGGALLQGEDIDLCERLLDAGKRLLYEPGAVVYHWISAERFELRYWRKRAFDTGKTLGLQLEKSLPRAALFRESAKKAAKLPLHAAVWLAASFAAERETMVARERSVFVTLGLLRHLLRGRGAKDS
jgi:GT2 family glycosyltransferase